MPREPSRLERAVALVGEMRDIAQELWEAAMGADTPMPGGFRDRIHERCNAANALLLEEHEARAGRAYHLTVIETRTVTYEVEAETEEKAVEAWRDGAAWIVDDADVTSELARVEAADAQAA
jgi:hypothetical protein